jgi:CRP-like cAMP-binding protein
MSTDVTLRGAAKTVRFEAHGGVFLLKEGGHGDSFVEVGFAKNRAATQAAQQPAPSSKKKHRKS